jgi:hypothetical protein
MAQATEDNIEICELSLHLQLRKAGMRLKRNGFRYQIMYGPHVLIAGNGRGEALALDEIQQFVERSLVR